MNAKLAAHWLRTSFSTKMLFFRPSAFQVRAENLWEGFASVELTELSETKSLNSQLKVHACHSPSLSQMYLGQWLVQ